MSTPAQDPDTGTGQQLQDYVAYWDQPTEVLMADGHPEVAIYAVKNGLEAGGIVLQYPAPPESKSGWTHIDTSPDSV